ncbi:hypothetical protein BDP27DRAFT_1361268 [Rhodocollybia butyracea]|uniref:Uncharacterized protein n=1 Tax=Rhodocollybia butyracea TaxID=206335 RepID=A0A9P5U9Q1_9AGAR|nr:hypothetical protein BDP27DRAFT_1361268 [Rhodocollybia butyracea]
MSIYSQLKMYLQRFNLPLESCNGDAKRLRQCLIIGLWRTGKWCTVLRKYDFVKLCGLGMRVLRVLGGIRLFMCFPALFPVHEETSVCLNALVKIPILTEIEPEWLLGYSNQCEDNKGSCNVVPVFTL